LKASKRHFLKVIDEGNVEIVKALIAAGGKDIVNAKDKVSV
jgi:hypothetical protein